MTFGLFTNIAPVGSKEHIYIYVPFIHGEVLTGPATSDSSHFPFGGTCFLTNSPFTPAWDVVLVRSASDMNLACRVSVLWSAYLTHSRSCGSSSVRTLDLLLAPGSSHTYAGCASSWNGTLRCVLSKVDGTLTVAIEPVFILPDTELTDEVLHT